MKTAIRYGLFALVGFFAIGVIVTMLMLSFLLSTLLGVSFFGVLCIFGSMFFILNFIILNALELKLESIKSINDKTV